MRKHPMTRARLIVLCALGAFATLVPTASADTSLPVWTCRASAGYVEVNPLLATQRVEPVLANGFPDRVNSDQPVCSTENTGVQRIEIPPNTGAGALITAEAASASTRINPEIAAARNQTATADAGIATTVRLNVAGLVIEASAITATARGTCVAGQPQLTSSSTILSLSIAGQPAIVIPDAGQGPVDINLGVARVRLNQQEIVTDPATGDRTLTRQAAHIEVLPVSGGQPVARVVLGEVKVDFHGAVCAPAPPPPTCPAGTVAQDPNATPLVCLLPVITCAPGSAPNPTVPGTCVLQCPANATPNQQGACVITEVVGPPPCPEGTTADPNAAGACIRPGTPPACPAGTARDPNSQACILLIQRPCPPGATADPATRVCVVRIVDNVGSGEFNGNIGSATGQPATCGRIEMHFVRGRGRTLRNKIGTRVVTRGRLVTCGSNRRPIIGARVDVVHILPDGRRLRKTGLRSRAAGRLTLILPNDLRSRRIEYTYRPDLNLTRFTSRVVLRLTVVNRRGRVLR